MNKLILFLITGFSLFLFTSCKTAKTSAEGNIGQTLSSGSTWVLRTINGNETAYGNDAFLKFDPEKNTLSGNTSCNLLNAGYEINGDRMTISQGITTRRACLGENIENEFLKNINEVYYFEIKNNILTLYNADRKELFTFAKNQE
ncbi:MAG: META domain-containing protein [Candidatus Azobacteroides sp.]|nr:META domain-containing protein [Candidatus Azobacteroides sp.]